MYLSPSLPQYKYTDNLTNDKELSHDIQNDVTFYSANSYMKLYNKHKNDSKILLKNGEVEMIETDFFYNIEIKEDTVLNKEVLLYNLDEVVKTEKKINNLDVNKVSLTKMREFIKEYAFNILPKDITIYPQTGDVGLLWNKYFDGGNVYIYLFVRENGLYYQTIIEENGIEEEIFKTANSEYKYFEIFMQEIEKQFRELNVKTA